MQSERYMGTVVAVGEGSAPVVEATRIVVNVNPLRVHLDRVRTRACRRWVYFSEQPTQLASERALAAGGGPAFSLRLGA